MRLPPLERLINYQTAIEREQERMSECWNDERPDAYWRSHDRLTHMRRRECALIAACEAY